MIWIYELCRTSIDTYRLISKFPFFSLWEMPNGQHAGRWSRYCVFGNDTFTLVPLSTYEDKWLTVNPPGSLIKKRGGVAMLLVASLYRIWDKLWPDEPFDLLGNFAWYVNRFR